VPLLRFRLARQSLMRRSDAAREHCMTRLRGLAHAVSARDSLLRRTSPARALTNDE